MDEVAEFMRGFAQAELAARAAVYVEDAATFRRRLDAAQAFFWDAPWGSLSISMAQVSDAGDTPKNHAIAERLRPREIFLIKRYEHATLGELFAVYASLPDPSPPSSYGDLFYVARKDGARKIVSFYRRNVMGDPPRWENMGGDTIGRLRAPVAVRKLTPPGDVDDRAEYDAA